MLLAAKRGIWDEPAIQALPIQRQVHRQNSTFSERSTRPKMRLQLRAQYLSAKVECAAASAFYAVWVPPVRGDRCVDGEPLLPPVRALAVSRCQGREQSLDRDRLVGNV